MKMISIGSKQIPYVRYDDQASQMHIHYYTGQTLTCSGVAPDQYRQLLQSPNRYDMIMRMTALQPGLTHQK
ncbi:KTSC domain-containing protein [Paenibacillus sp. UNCCL117]|uniref:KTSC domain-containing protein n=1 Tax=unclassified Paenibacillus TaxID=185978 RepID=UPI000889D25D|nr:MULTISPECIES: KTSC domain-containing protein [unclassified Paenibacillus]SDE23384.1 KTSC domain-containing protein [Paenibacillus sp. cl123]SFW42627.1 KTSC domain-containing protein [Paenibacillus sp. UNCCL117]